MVDLTKREKEVLIELLKNGRKSDQEIARTIKTSRPTVARIRKRLEQRGLIQGYSTYTKFEELGLTVNAVILYRWVDYSKKKELTKSIEFVRKQPEVVMFIKGEGMGSKTNVIISVHENLKAYENFIIKLKENWGRNVEDVEVFISSIAGIYKRYDMSEPVINRLKKNK
jgi:DNA-binding Lrp family transcriptional regulator